MQFCKQNLFKSVGYSDCFSTKTGGTNRAEVLLFAEFPISYHNYDLLAVLLVHKQHGRIKMVQVK